MDSGSPPQNYGIMPVRTPPTTFKMPPKLAEYFEVIGQQDRSVSVRCKICERTIKSYMGVTSNLHTHLKRMHDMDMNPDKQRGHAAGSRSYGPASHGGMGSAEGMLAAAGMFPFPVAGFPQIGSIHSMHGMPGSQSPMSMSSYHANMGTTGSPGENQYLTCRVCSIKCKHIKCICHIVKDTGVFGKSSYPAKKVPSLL